MIDWVSRKLGEVCDIKIGGTPSRNVPAYWDGSNSTENYWVSIKDLNQRIITDTVERLSDLGVRNSNAKLIPANTVLLSFKLTIGRVAFTGRDLYTNEAIAALLTEQINNDFLYYGLQQWDLMKDVDQAIKGATLNKEKLKNVEITFPEDINQQIRIAAILSCIDRAIDQTEALIAKQQRIKTGLMQDLLTKGIDEHGNIRSEATHEFKDSPLGRIPKEWDIWELFNYISFLKSGLSRRILDQDIGVPVLVSGNIQENQLDTSELKYWYRQDPQGAKTENYFLDSGDILLCFINSLDQIGKLCLYWDIGRPCIYTTNLFRIKPSIYASHEFLYYLLCSSQVQSEIKLITKAAVNQASFTTGDFLDIEAVRVPPEEQIRITETLNKFQQSLESETHKLSKLMQIKVGLMQDLLTGKVSVENLFTEQMVAIS